MTDIVKIPVRYRRPREIRGREIFESPKPSDLMVWEVCTYVRGWTGDGCKGCPATFDDPDDGKCTEGCRVWAEEACRVMMAVQRREAASPETKAT